VGSKHEERLLLPALLLDQKQFSGHADSAQFKVPTEGNHSIASLRNICKFAAPGPRRGSARHIELKFIGSKVPKVPRLQSCRAEEYAPDWRVCSKHLQGYQSALGSRPRPECYGRAAQAVGQKASRRLSLIATVSALANIRHERFFQLYVKLGNASETYRQAGYRGKNADVLSAQLLVNPSICKRISEIRADQSDKCEMTKDQLRQFLVSVILARWTTRKT
jgi:hypothetical protein